MTKDLTRGSPMKLILSFGVPVLLGYLFQQLYSVVDTAIVGKVLGGGALAAVGATGPINFLVVGFCTGICSGFAIPVAQQFGAGREDELRRYVAGGVWLSVGAAVLMTLLTVTFCRPMLTLMQTPADIYNRSCWYIGTIFAGLSAYMLYNYCAGVLRALGDSKTPVIWLVVASLVNIALDLLFILAFDMDVFGAALATVLSQALAGFGCLVRMCRGFPVLKLSQEDWAWSWERAKHLCIMGFPMGLQYSITALGSIMIQTAVNTLGTVAVTAVTAASKVSLFLCCPFDAMGATMATYCGQNVGAGKWDRLRQGMVSCVILGAGYSVAAFGLVYFFADSLNMLFLDEGNMVLLPMAGQYLMALVTFYFALALVDIVRFSIQGMGFSPLATFAGVLEMAARAGVSLLVPCFGFTAACYASPAAWVLADLFLIPAWVHCCRKLQRIVPETPHAARTAVLRPHDFPWSGQSARNGRSGAV